MTVVKDFASYVKNKPELSLLASPRSSHMLTDNNVRGNLSEQVMDYVVGQILMGEYLPGGKISPKEIASKLKVSLMPVRDAFEKLQEKRWIVKYPQRGTYVKKVSHKDLLEICQIRSMIECESIRCLLEKYNTETISKLGRIIEQNEKARMKGDLARYRETDGNFHSFIVRTTKNSRMIDLFETIRSQVIYYFTVIIWRSETMRQHDMMDLNKIPISHISIFEAIKQRNADVAIELMRIHLAKGAGRFWQMAKMQHMADEEASDAFNMQNIE